MAGGLYRGAEIVPTYERSAYYQNELAAIGGPDIKLSFGLKDDPVSVSGVCLSLGHGGSEMLLLRQGVHYRVSGRSLFWLGTAPFALTSDSILGVTYYTQGNTA